MLVSILMSEFKPGRGSQTFRLEVTKTQVRWIPVEPAEREIPTVPGSGVKYDPRTKTFSRELEFVIDSNGATRFVHKRPGK